MPASVSPLQRQTALFLSHPVLHQHNIVRWLLVEGARYNWLQNIMRCSLINNLSEMCCAVAVFLQWFLAAASEDGKGTLTGVQEH